MDRLKVQVAIGYKLQMLSKNSLLIENIGSIHAILSKNKDLRNLYDHHRERNSCMQAVHVWRPKIELLINVMCCCI